MDIVQVRDFMLTLPFCEETQPFGEDFAVYKAGGKMFACVAFDRPEYIAVKCDPDRAVALRDRYSEITSAWHFNKRHWNDIRIGPLEDSFVEGEIRHSYLTVIRKNVTPKSLREQLLSAAAEAGIEDAGPLGADL